MAQMRFQGCILSNAGSIFHCVPKLQEESEKTSIFFVRDYFMIHYWRRIQSITWIHKQNICNGMPGLVSYVLLTYMMTMMLVYSDCKEKPTFPNNLQDIKKFIELEKIKRKIKTNINIRQFTENRTIADLVPTEYPSMSRPVLIISEHADSQDCMLFPLTKANVTAEEVLVQVDLWVYIKVNKMKRKETKRNNRKKNGRRLKIAATSERQKLSILSVRVKKSKWHKLQLPLSLIQTILVNPDKNLILCLTCSRCNKRYNLVLMCKDASVGKNSNNRPTRKLSDKKTHWPFIVLHMKSQMFS